MVPWIVALVAVLLALRNRPWDSRRVKFWEERCAQLQREREALEAVAEQLRGELRTLDRDFAAFRGREEQRRQDLEEKLQFLERARVELDSAFRAAAAEVAEKAIGQLGERSREQSKQALEGVENALKPLREGVERLDARVLQVDRRRAEESGRLEENLRQLFTAQRELDRETRRLNQALRQSHVRGRWGELQLRRIVELAGLQDHVDFEEQVAVAVDNATLRADLVVHLPHGRRIIVDAKAVMEAHVAAGESATEQEREEWLRQHGQNVFNRVQELGKKNYWKYFDAAFDHVVLFLPGDHLYAAALAARPTLFDEALERHVLLASPMTLLALLKTVAHGWAQEAAAREAAEIVTLGKTFLERVRILFEKLSLLGGQLRKTVETYNGAVASAEGRLRPTLQSFGQLRSLQGQETAPELEALEDRVRLPARQLE
ncbi:MAG: DNA recombination protein RmuC [Puniceicoccales bacterium]|jgi:DNA recombination protein RmuC|nr:DNA recombination protein RmuC [Puniceicoccales bacterium]